MGENDDGERIAKLEKDMEYIKDSFKDHIDFHKESAKNNTSNGQFKATTTIAVILLVMESIDFISNIYDRNIKWPSEQIGIERQYQGDDK